MTGAPGTISGVVDTSSVMAHGKRTVGILSVCDFSAHFGDIQLSNLKSALTAHVSLLAPVLTQHDDRGILYVIKRNQHRVFSSQVFLPSC